MIDRWEKTIAERETSRASRLGNSDRKESLGLCQQRRDLMSIKIALPPSCPLPPSPPNPLNSKESKAIDSSTSDYFPYRIYLFFPPSFPIFWRGNKNKNKRGMGQKSKIGGESYIEKSQFWGGSEGNNPDVIYYLIKEKARHLFFFQDKCENIIIIW